MGEQIHLRYTSILLSEKCFTAQVGRLHSLHFVGTGSRINVQAELGQRHWIADAGKRLTQALLQRRPVKESATGYGHSFTLKAECCSNRDVEALRGRSVRGENIDALQLSGGGGGGGSTRREHALRRRVELRSFAGWR